MIRTWTSRLITKTTLSNAGMEGEEKQGWGQSAREEQRHNLGYSPANEIERTTMRREASNEAFNVVSASQTESAL